VPGKIPPTFIDELIARVDIVELIDSRVPLIKKGREFSACCPFHHEKTPSFTVSPTKQFYHCFGCGAHGTAIGFLMEYENMPFPEAIEELAAKAGVEVPRESDDGRPSENLTPLFSLMNRVDEWYRKQLKEHPQKGAAVKYLKQRGVSGEIAANYGLGFAPDGWSNLLDSIGRDTETIKELIRTGMAISKDGGGHYDRFRNRIMFPIHDSRGRTIGFGGRVLGDDKPKYLNSPESPLFHKGRELYGLYQARKNVRTLNHIIVVEGYMDVVALAQFGIRYCVATLGTATTTDHLNQLFRTVTKVIFCFDGDRAGRDAAVKAMDNAIPLLRDGREILFMFLPDGEDPDSLVRGEGTAKFEKRVESATPLSQFFFTNLENQVDVSSIDGRARLVSLARPKLSLLPAGIFREMMFKQLSNLVEMDEDTISSHLLDRDESVPPQRIKQREQQKSRKALPRTGAQGPSPVRISLSILLNNPHLISTITELNSTLNRLKKVESAGIDLLTSVIALLIEFPELSSAALLERWRGSENEDLLNKVAEWNSSIPESGVQQELNGALQSLLKFGREQRTEELLAKSKVEKLSTDEKYELQQLLSA
jgi:DNA primase